MTRLVKVVGIGVALVALVVFAGAAMAFAQDPDGTEPVNPDSTEGVVPGLGFGHRGGRFGGGAFGRGGFGDKEAREAALADALGISVEELEAAQLEARATLIEQAEAEGLITAEQADLLLALPELQTYMDREAWLASALGMSVEELQAALEDGTRLSDLIEELGLDPITVRESVQAARAEAIQQAVDDDVITQAQADEILSGSEFGFHLGLEGRGFGGGRGHGRGPGGAGLGSFGTGQNGNGVLAPAFGA
jgi:hypothetical protein